MTKKKIGSLGQMDDLRRQAEEKARSLETQELEALSPEETRQTFHELRVHQIELIMQNEELRRAHAELDAAQARYFDLYDHAPVGYCTVSEEGLILEANLTAATLLGVARSTLVQKPLTGFIFREDQDLYYHHRQQLYKTGAAQVCELRMVKKDSSLFWVRLESTVTQDSENGDTGYTLCRTVISDITKRKQAEKALQESDEIFKQFMENSPNYVFFKNDKMQAIRLSRNYEKMLGKPMHELLGKTTDDLFPSDLAKSMIADDLRVLNEGKQVTVEEELNGRFYTTIKFPILIKGKPRYLAGYTTDITERKQMERGLIYSERMAIAGQLAAGVAHEFNNLLSIIGGNAEYVKGIRNENEINKSLDMIVKSVNRGAQVVKKMLTFSKRIELKKESVDLIEVIEEVLGLVKRDLENNSITVVRNYSDIPKTLIDVGQIQQVFLNLIINAKNAMSKGGELAVKVEKKGEFIKIQFHNTGRIINQEDLGKLFIPFFRTSWQQKKGIPGTGLGLAVSYGIIKAHHGVIKAESAKGKGTTLTILFPVTKNENRAEVLPKAAAKAVKNNKRKLKQAEILIVDDEVEIGKLFKQVLDKEGYSVTVADSGRNALNWCRKKKFDLIYLDIVMPGMDGISVFKKINKISPKTKIVFFTGKLIEDKVAGMYLDEGAAGFLRKPIPLKELVSYTQNILKAKNEKNLLLF